jgi:tetratricopeptide (TPR) repeat protein
VLLVVTLKERQPILIFLLLALALTYGLVGNMVMLIGTSMGERLMYTPSAFLTILFAWGLSKGIPKKVPYTVVLVILIGLASLRTVTYALQWNDPVELFESAVRAQPASVHLRLLLADEYRKRGQLDKAEFADAQARDIRSDYWDSWFQSGQVAAEKGEFDQAEAYFKKSMDLQPNPYAYAWLLNELPKRRAAAATQRAATSRP